MSIDAALLIQPLETDAQALGAADRSRALLDRQIERLDRLADAGLDLVQAITDQARGRGPRVVEGDLALAHGPRLAGRAPGHPAAVQADRRR